MTHRIRRGEGGKQIDRTRADLPTIIRLQQFVVEIERDSPAFYVNAVVQGTDASRLFRTTGGDVDGEALGEAFAVHMLPVIEAGLRDGTLEPNEYRQVTLRLDGEHLATAAKLLASKECKYREHAQGDDYCDAGSKGRLRTSRAMCEACVAPDTRLACSNLHHVRTADTSSTMSSSISVVGYVCDLGKPEADAARCKFGGLECWEHQVVLAPRNPAALPPLAVHESIDYFGAVWLNAFKRPLLGMSVVAPGGVLATACTSSQDLQAKLSALGEVFNSFQVEHDDPGLSGSLARMRAKLKSWGEQKGGTSEDIAGMERTMEVFQNILRLRAGQQHGPARDRSERAMLALGLSLPATSYSEAWNRIQSLLHDALAELRRFIRERG